MRFLTAVHTDVGLKKKTNQDSALIMQAQTDAGPVLLAAICDGMGGLAKGEVASAAMTHGLENWFSSELPALLAGGLEAEALRAGWDALVQRTARRIADYGAGIHVDMGTTAAVLLLTADAYYIMNVGDSRVYALSDQLYQLTKDQTYVQREIDLGRMTPEQAAVDEQRSVLLQCIGASPKIEPDFFTGRAALGQSYLLCCDGFRHVLHPQEIYNTLCPAATPDEAAMKRGLQTLTELNKSRREEDNITAILIRTC